MDPDPRPPPTVTYWAVSVLSSRTNWLNAVAFLVALSSLTDATQILPLRFLPIYGACVAGLNLLLRQLTVRPTAFILPGNTKPVDVPKVGPPDPPVITD
jgi:hypothetical protein